MNEDALRRALKAEAPLRFFETTTSTNADAKAWADDGAPHGALVAAAAQTAGRGRLGRAFASPPGGIYISTVLRPGADFLNHQTLLTPAAAVAVCRAVARLCGVQLQIKWVNDLFCGGKKCCGILAETRLGAAGVDYAVVGIGLNYAVPPTAFPPELRGIAASLYTDGQIAPVPPEQLAAAIRAELLAAFDALCAGGSGALLAEYRSRSNVLGRRVTVLAAPPYEATALAIDDEARLVVQADGGAQTALGAGEISVKL